MMNEFEEAEDKHTRDRIRDIVRELLDSSEGKTDVEDEGDSRQDIGLLGPNPTTTQMMNKINELINSFNKTLRDYRI